MRMDSHGSFFGRFAASARVGSGDGGGTRHEWSVRVGLGALGLLHSACHHFGCIARQGTPGKPKAAALWHSWLKR